MTPVEKFIAEVRALLAGVPTHPEDGSVNDLDKAAACESIRDALTAYDAAVAELADDAPSGETP